MTHAPDHPAGESLLDYTVRKAQEAGGGGTAIDTGEPPKDTLLDTKTIKGVTYKAYKRADGSLYVVNTDTGEVLDGSFADNDLGGTGTYGGSEKPPKDIVYKGDKAYREAANGALTRTPEYDLEPSKPATTGIRSQAVSRTAGRK